MRDHVQSVLDTLRQPSGLYVASPSETYHYVWIRDNCYIALSELYRNNGRYEETYHAILDVLKKYEWKLSHHAKHRPLAVFEYIHPRYSADTLEELNSPWGNAQNDAIGAFLFGLGQGLRAGKTMLRDDSDRHLVSLLIQYLITLEFWRDEDNGMWEEHREWHASSVGACTAGLLSLRPYFEIPLSVIRSGFQSLFGSLPGESETKQVDLALLSLIYPYQLLPVEFARIIIHNVETQLLRNYGVIRYPGDQYYAEHEQEAEWCMGLPWLGLCHLYLGNEDKGKTYQQRTEAIMTERHEVPELYLPVSQVPNENTPLGWANALYLVLRDTLSGAVAKEHVRG